MEKEREVERAYIILLGIFVGGITIASVLASKIINVAGLFVPAGILAYSITFTCTDVISEVWGAKRARDSVLAGFISLVIVLVLAQIAIVWPKAPFWNNSEAFDTILGTTSRVIVASLVAYLASQFHDVWMFHFLRRLTKGKYLWIRNNASTAISQFFDSFIFIVIAFWGVMPIWPLIIGQWVVKIVIAILDTPVIYLVVWILRKIRGKNESYIAGENQG